jgi:hypothetical protein
MERPSLRIRQPRQRKPLVKDGYALSTWQALDAAGKSVRTITPITFFIPYRVESPPWSAWWSFNARKLLLTGESSEDLFLFAASYGARLPRQLIRWHCQ